jgi:hypothetical protein
LGSVFEHGADLFVHDASPLYELRNLRTILEVLEQCGHGYARTAEHPGSTYTLWIPLTSGASRPVDHGPHDSIGSFQQPLILQVRLQDITI